jgi:single-strand DNA-binding protein
MNKVILIGNVGKDPDVRYVDNDVAVTSFPLATTERGYTLQNGTTVPDRTEWHNIILWRGLAQTAEKFVHKGDKLYIEGKIHTRSYDDKQGVKKYITEIYADEMFFPEPPLTNTSPSGVVNQQSAQIEQTEKQTVSRNNNNGDLPF